MASLIADRACYGLGLRYSDKAAARGMCLEQRRGWLISASVFDDPSGGKTKTPLVDRFLKQCHNSWLS
jgi:hypothetical protein